MKLTLLEQVLSVHTPSLPAVSLSAQHHYKCNALGLLFAFFIFILFRAKETNRRAAVVDIHHVPITISSIRPTLEGAWKCYK